MRLRDLGEFNFIERIAGRIKVSGKVIKGIGDDTSVLRYRKDKYLLFTCDMLIEGKHFSKKRGGYLTGKKSLSVSISDIAAMGGEPKFALISLGVPASLDLKYTDELYKGIANVARKFKIDLAGGDTVNSGRIVINIAVLGEVEKKNLVLRSTAKEGDAIFVTGSIGGSYHGRHLSFTPRLKEARFLVRNFEIRSMIDISDGLIADIGHILKSSNAAAVIYEKNIPLSKNAKDFNSAIRDGEDFELAFTMPESLGDKAVKAWPFKTRLSKIGKVLNGPAGRLYLIRKNGKEEKITTEGYTHF